MAVSVSGGSEGTSAGIVLTFPVSARSLAMGNAYTVSRGDLSGVWCNPAVLAGLDGRHITAFYERRIAGDRHGGLMMSYPLGGGSLGAHLLQYSSGDVELIRSDGETRTVTGQTDYVVGLSYGIQIGENLGTAVTVKMIRSTLAEEFTASSVSFDAGLIYGLPEDGLLCGVSLRNLGPDLEYRSEKEPLPRSIGFGASYRTSLGDDHLVAAMDIVKIRGADFRQHIGFEYVLGNNIALRAGYRLGYDSAGFTFGLGARVGGLELSHGVGLVQTFDNVHLFQISYRF